MRLLNHILILLFFLLGSLASCTKVEAAPSAKAVAVKGKNQGAMPEGQPPIQEHQIALAPFYRLQCNGSKAWIERILVTFTMTAPKTCLKHDFDNPTFRKMFFELLQSGESEATIQAQTLAYLKRQVGAKIAPAVQISRSVLIVR